MRHKKKKLYRIVIAVAAVLIITFFLIPTYIYNALKFGHPKIDNFYIFASRKVSNSDPMPWQNDSLYNVSKLDSDDLKIMRSYSTTAFVVIRNNKILHEEYWDRTNDSTRSNSFSVAKSIISLMIGCLVEEGKIKIVEDPVMDYLPEFKNTYDFKLTIKDLLTMSSGLNWDEEYSSLFAPTTKAYYGTSLIEQVMELEVRSEPGRIFNYQSCNTQLLALIIEKVSGKIISDYASEKLWKPLGAEHAALWSLDKPGGIEKAYCCFNSTATDFARIGQLVLDSGQFNNKQLVSKTYLAQATSPATWLKDNNEETCNYYGYHFWLLTHKGMKVVYARGILGQYIFIIPSLNAVVVRLGRDRSKEYLNHAPKDAYAYLDAAFKLMGNTK